MSVKDYFDMTTENDIDYVTYASLEEVLKESDYVTLHCPLNENTKHIINKDTLSLMKSSSFIINTARGAVINEKDVANALNTGKLSYFGADVLSTEPPKKDNPLLSARNTFLTPHIAWAAYETRLRLLEILNGNIKAFLEGNPINVVNM